MLHQTHWLGHSLVGSGYLEPQKTSARQPIARTQVPRCMCCPSGRKSSATRFPKATCRCQKMKREAANPLIGQELLMDREPLISPCQPMDTLLVCPDNHFGRPAGTAEHCAPACNQKIFVREQHESKEEQTNGSCFVAGAVPGSCVISLDSCCLSFFVIDC